MTPFWIRFGRKTSLHNEVVELSEAIDVIEEVLASGGEFLLYPRGRSMLPLIRQDKDYVVLARKTKIQKHDMAFYRRDNGQFVIHRVMKCEADGTYTMCGDHQVSWEKGIRGDQIIGYVQRLYRNGRLIRFTSLRYRLYLWLWSWMLFRRGCFFLRRIFRKRRQEV